MQDFEAKAIIQKLGLTGKEFAKLLNANTNYVSNFNRVGVPQNIGIMLRLCETLLEKSVSKEAIVEIIKTEVVEFAKKSVKK